MTVEQQSLTKEQATRVMELASWMQIDADERDFLELYDILHEAHEPELEEFLSAALELQEAAQHFSDVWLASEQIPLGPEDIS